ncbi:uncharacterized protein LOC127001113 isoform X2 [Eriocheir sinensis]|uniref:uncharacterized protein LOC127001113 isoform X2 n=1 Tax=Eriocheir sinensis TaxID=95602 RepID=UPI0021CA12BB|nr:uncharacterized protein LOC127001113 isoform X2 [Eriocheir sinensis]
MLSQVNISSAGNCERRNAIPVIYTSGTYYEVGFDVGRTFRGLIQDYLASSVWLRETLLPAYETEAGRAAYDETLPVLKENFPQYLRELQGTADGAQVPFLHVLLGHTEDTFEEMMNYLYLVSATISEEAPEGRLGTRTESFTALCYPGHLPGFCLGYNRHGLVSAINDIVPLKVFPARTPPHFLCRALLSATSVEAAHDILRDRGTGGADGFGVNMIFMRPDGGHVFQNVEVGTAGAGDENPLSIVTLSVGEHYFHANRYLHLTGIPEKSGPPEASSEHREVRASQFWPPTPGGSAGGAIRHQRPCVPHLQGETPSDPQLDPGPWCV